MDQRVPAELLVLAPKRAPQDGADPIDQAGHAVVAMLHQAAHLSEENLQRAMSMAHKVSVQLRAAEDRIAQLQGEVEHLQKRANRAEQVARNDQAGDRGQPDRFHRSQSARAAGSALSSEFG